LKVGGTGPERKWGGAPIRREAPENFFLAYPLLFGSNSTFSRFGERFRDNQYSLVGFLSAVHLLTVPPRAQSFVKVGGTCPHAPWSRRHWIQRLNDIHDIIGRHRHVVWPRRSTFYFSQHFNSHRAILFLQSSVRVTF